ncbi:MAG: transposase [Bacteroidales bacterium]
MKKRRKFDREYKQMAVELPNAREDISALAAELDLRVDLIYRWRQEALANLGAKLPEPGQ